MKFKIILITLIFTIIFIACSARRTPHANYGKNCTAPYCHIPKEVKPISIRDENEK